MQHQALFFPNIMSLPKLSTGNFTGDPLKRHQWSSFFRATIHNNRATQQNSATHKSRDSISGYSYNGDHYHEAIAELTKTFDKPQHLVDAYLDQLEKWAKPRLDEPKPEFELLIFLGGLIQTFRLHKCEADLKSSAVLRLARDKVNAPMIIRWNQHTFSQALLQHKSAHIADWVDSYAEADKNISPQRSQ